MDTEVQLGMRYLAIDKIDAGLVYKIETDDNKCIFIQSLTNKEALDILTAEQCDHIYPSFQEEYNTNFSVITPFSKRRTIITLPEKGYTPVINLDTGAIEVVSGEEYNATITWLRGASNSLRYALMVTELDHNEVISYGKKLGNLVMLRLPKKHQDDSAALKWKPTYKDEIDYANLGIEFLSTRKEIEKAYDLRRIKGDLDLEWYYYNWNTISEEERKEVLDWLSAHDWGFKLANKLNRLV